MKYKGDQDIRIFLGTDTKRSRDALRKSLEGELKDNPNAVIYRFDDTSFEPSLLYEALANISLFGGRNIIVLDGILDHDLGQEFYLTPGQLSRTTSLVLVRETTPPKELHALLEEVGRVETFPLGKIVDKKNPFIVADAVAMRDKRKAWVEFVKLERSGAAMEEIHGMIFWAVKTLQLCKTQTKADAAKAGVKEYTYRNYEPRAKYFLLQELNEKLFELKEMYHRAHQSGGDLAISLEQFLLKL